MLKFLSRRHLPIAPPLIVRADKVFRNVFAIGDIHGCLDQLSDLELMIAQAVGAADETTLLIYLGDYIDRGPNSAGVIAHCLSPPLRPWSRIFLSGNHEEMMLDFIARPAQGHPWLNNGGDETLRSYGIEPELSWPDRTRSMSRDLAGRMPAAHRAFLIGLPHCVTLPDFTFVHAGLRPGVPLNLQTQADMLWLRLPVGTLSASQPFGTLVHGHTPAAAPVIEPHRICVDTGAFATGVLTAAHIAQDGTISFLSTAPSDDGAMRT